jgi:phosphatidylserine/phosphatidylglycerophosphate/cardiolipin synthase-like enzyme
MQARRPRGALAALAALLLAGCAAAPIAAQPGASRVATGPGATATSAAGGCAAGCLGPGTRAVQVFVEPAAGARPVTDAIAAANASVWLEVYLLTDTRVIHALEDAAARGVDVRVMLEPSPFGEGPVAPQKTLEELQAAGVQARASDPAFHYTHEKAMVVDAATAYIMTCNLTRSGLGGSSAATNREFGVVDTDPADVAEARAIFQADWNRAAGPALPDANLVVSPVNARARLAALITAARTSLDVEDEEMVDPGSEDALAAAARRGVRVEVVLPAPSAGAAPSPDVARLMAAGVQVRYSLVLYMHAKLILADGMRAFVGSENFSATSLDENRELGVIVADPAALATLATTFGSDWDGSEPA